MKRTLILLALCAASLLPIACGNGKKLAPKPRIEANPYLEVLVREQVIRRVHLNADRKKHGSALRANTPLRPAITLVMPVTFRDRDRYAYDIPVYKQPGAETPSTSVQRSQREARRGNALANTPRTNATVFVDGNDRDIRNVAYEYVAELADLSVEIDQLIILQPNGQLGVYEASGEGEKAKLNVQYLDWTGHDTVVEKLEGIRKMSGADLLVYITADATPGFLAWQAGAITNNLDLPVTVVDVMQLDDEQAKPYAALAKASQGRIARVIP